MGNGVPVRAYTTSLGSHLLQMIYIASQHPNDVGSTMLAAYCQARATATNNKKCDTVTSLAIYEP